jgi:IS1 family transposase/transposase-like protein
MMTSIECAKCYKVLVRNGKSKTGEQRYYCKQCKKYSQEHYRNVACSQGITQKIMELVKESCGIRSIARLLRISCVTVIKRIKDLGKVIQRPFPIVIGKSYEVDEMRTFIGNKKKLYWIVYALRKDTREVIDFKVGKRTSETLQKVTDTVQLSGASQVCTDRFPLYERLIEKTLHHKSKYKINYIERKNLSIRTHLKRLSRKTICFSRSKEMLKACLKIYFWSASFSNFH